MRTSKISKDTSRIFNALSPNARSSRLPRSHAKAIATQSGEHDVTATYDDAEEDRSVASTEDVVDATLASTPSAVEDIEDAGRLASPNPKKRRRTTTKVELSPKKIVETTVKTEESDQTTFIPTRRSARQAKRESDAEIKVDDEETHELAPDGTPIVSSRKSLPKIPAKRKLNPDGTYTYTPPSNWETIYDLVAEYRAANPTAPVDTMGCEDLFWQSSPPEQKRYHTLTALMLSSQTKDTMTAAAMNKLHTELLEKPDRDPETGKIKSSCLTIQNVLDADPVRLNACIRQVGFHNVKTKNIKRVAQILKDDYRSDIPDTIEGLISLPGVGPKMAHLTMSGAWGKTEGIGVDVHVHRITNLWGWQVTKEPEQTRMWLEGWLPKEKWHHINKMLVGFGQTVCLPVGRKCGECPLSGKGLCKSEIRGWVKKEERKRVKKEKVEIKTDKTGTKVADVDDEPVKVSERTTIKEELVDS